MTLTFKYKDVARSNGTNALSPSIPATLSNGGTKYNIMVLLDSGADFSAIPKSIAELLGLDLNGEKEKTFGIGGEVSTVGSLMNIELERAHEKYSFKIPVKVILEGPDFPPLVGRAVFFDKFDITFRQHDKKVDLKPRAQSNF